MEFVFFSMNDFTREGGATIRMYGILNELARQNHKLVFISNAKNLSKFDKQINHVFINYRFNSHQKRLFQGLTSILPPYLLLVIYRRYFKRIALIINSNALSYKTIFFFEYLDNTIGYLLKTNHLISNYINDLHGIATTEFKFQADNSTSFIYKTMFFCKYCMSKLLDQKVFNNAYGLIFPSKEMKQFFLNIYPKLLNKKNYVLPNVLSPEVCEQEVNLELRQKLVKDLEIKDVEVILLFSGAFKQTGGVPDLLLAYSNLIIDYPFLRLLLIGDGPTLQECRAIIQSNRLDSRVTLVGRIPYDELRTYQDLAHIIICPDRMNVYSELIIHVKYFDALVSGKIVINGSFKSVQEINKNQFLSVEFEPSNIESLIEAIKYCVESMDVLNSKFQNNRQHICRNLTYSTLVKELLR